MITVMLDGGHRVDIGGITFANDAERDRWIQAFFFSGPVHRFGDVLILISKVVAVTFSAPSGKTVVPESSNLRVN